MTTDPHATCQTPLCGHPQDEHSRLSGCLHFGNGATPCACPEFVPPALPVTPYDGGTSSGHSGSDTSHQRALTEDANGTTGNRQAAVLNMVGPRAQSDFPRFSEGHGITVRELREVTGWHHGQASAALSNLHKAGELVRLTETRDRCKVYTLPRYTLSRETEPAGSRPSKPRTPKSRGPVTLTPDQADSLRRLRSLAQHHNASSDVEVMVSAFDLAKVTDALQDRVREPRQ